MIAEWINEELCNWARWCHSGPQPIPFPPDHCRSIEYRWIEPSDLYKEAPPPRQPSPNRQRAEIVHRVYLERLTDRERQAIKVRYVWRDPKPWKHMRVGQAAYEAALITVARMVGEAFRESQASRCA
ncbi:MAG: hypothetical protein NUV51_04385 [Sulfuricaulis sp.]|nr:hypothetical protein [Sulfuricaulis sp.]